MTDAKQNKSQRYFTVEDVDHVVELRDRYLSMSRNNNTAWDTTMRSMAKTFAWELTIIIGDDFHD